MTDGHTLTCHYQPSSVVYIRVCSWRCTLSWTPPSKQNSCGQDANGLSRQSHTFCSRIDRLLSLSWGMTSVKKVLIRLHLFPRHKSSLISLHIEKNGQFSPPELVRYQLSIPCSSFQISLTLLYFLFPQGFCRSSRYVVYKKAGIDAVHRQSPRTENGGWHLAYM